MGWGKGEFQELYKGSGSTLKHQGILGRRGVLGWEAVTAEESLEADSPSPRAISSGFVPGTLSLLLYHLGADKYPVMALFVLSSSTLDHKGHGLLSPTLQGELVGGSLRVSNLSHHLVFQKGLCCREKLGRKLVSAEGWILLPGD